MYAALTIFSFLGHISVVKDIKIEEIAKSGPDLLFVAFPGLLNQIGGTHFFSFVFFVMCICLGVDSVFGFIDFSMKWFEVQFPTVFKMFGRQEYARAAFLFCNFLFSLIFCLQGGQWVFDMFDGYAGSMQLIMCF